MTERSDLGHFDNSLSSEKRTIHFNLRRLFVNFEIYNTVVLKIHG